MIGLGWINNLLLHLIMQPLLHSQLPFSKQTNSIETKNVKLDWRQGYVTGYSNIPNKVTGSIRNNFVSHTDDSEITLNACLGDGNFKDGKLIFNGIRNHEQHGQEQDEGEYTPIVGNGIIHSGRHLHKVSDVTYGNRYVLIIWARSWGDVRSVTCPCCWLNNRLDDCCVCDWN